LLASTPLGFQSPAEGRHFMLLFKPTSMCSFCLSKQAAPSCGLASPKRTASPFVGTVNEFHFVFAHAHSGIRTTLPIVSSKGALLSIATAVMHFTFSLRTAPTLSKTVFSLILTRVRHIRMPFDIPQPFLMPTKYRFYAQFKLPDCAELCMYRTR
jgi:hypothetical protein